MNTQGDVITGVPAATQPAVVVVLKGTQSTPLPVAPGAGSSTSTQTSVAQNAASVTLLAANAARFGASIENDPTSTASLYVRCAAAAASLTAQNVVLVPGAYFEVPFGYTGEIRGIWGAAGAGAARVAEYT